MLLLSACSLLSACQANQGPVYVPAYSPEIVYTGRVSFRNPEAPVFTYPGVQIKANFTGTSIAMQVKPKSGHFTVEIDGEAPRKVGTFENDSVIVLADSLPKGNHSITVMLAYEGRDFFPEFRGFILSPGGKMQTAPELPTRKIEFIGNSITCGYGIEAANEKEPFRFEDENFYYTYAATTARAFGAQHLVVAKSGIGIYRNYGDKKEGSVGTCLPDIYNETLYMDSTDIWDFNRYCPDVVCINLGTNDIQGNNFDKAKLQNAYYNFICTLRGHYPNAKIVLLSGVMLQGKILDEVQTLMNNAVDAVKKEGDNQVFRFDMTPQTGSLGYGSGYHPSKAQHRQMAKELTSFLQSITGWDIVEPVK